MNEMNEKTIEPQGQIVDVAPFIDEMSQSDRIVEPTDGDWIIARVAGYNPRPRLSEAVIVGVNQEDGFHSLALMTSHGEPSCDSFAEMVANARFVACAKENARAAIAAHGFADHFLKSGQMPTREDLLALFAETSKAITKFSPHEQGENAKESQ